MLKDASCVYFWQRGVAALFSVSTSEMYWQNIGEYLSVLIGRIDGFKCYLRYSCCFVFWILLLCSFNDLLHYLFSLSFRKSFFHGSRRLPSCVLCVLGGGWGGNHFLICGLCDFNGLDWSAGAFVLLTMALISVGPFSFQWYLLRLRALQYRRSA